MQLQPERYTEVQKKNFPALFLTGFDIHIDVPAIDVKKLAKLSSASRKPEMSSEIRKRITDARQVQQRRFKNESIHTNSEMKNSQIKKYSVLGRDSGKMMIEASAGFRLSARSYMKVIKTAQTIADIEGADEIRAEHIAEALQYRPRYFL